MKLMRDGVGKSNSVVVGDVALVEKCARLSSNKVSNRFEYTIAPNIPLQCSVLPYYCLLTSVPSPNSISITSLSYVVHMLF